MEKRKKFKIYLKIILNLYKFSKAAKMDLLLNVFIKNAIIKDQHLLLYLSKKQEDYLEHSQILHGNVIKNLFIKMVIHFCFHLDLMVLLKYLIIKRIKEMKLFIVIIYWLVLLMLLAFMINVMMLLNKIEKIGVIWIKAVLTKIKEWIKNKTRNIWQAVIIFQFKK